MFQSNIIFMGCVFILSLAFVFVPTLFCLSLGSFFFVPPGLLFLAIESIYSCLINLCITSLIFFCPWLIFFVPDYFLFVPLYFFFVPNPLFFVPGPLIGPRPRPPSPGPWPSAPGLRPPASGLRLRSPAPGSRPLVIGHRLPARGPRTPLARSSGPPAPRPASMAPASRLSARCS